MQGLDTFKKMVDELRSTNSRNDKMEILKKYPGNKDLLQIVMDPFKKFNVTKKSILKHGPADIDQAPDNMIDLIDLLNKLSRREISGRRAVNVCASTTEFFPDYKDLLLNIFNKNLEIRIGDKEINKVWPGLIPTYDVCLAKTCDDELLAKIKTEPDEWFIMRKLDGLRCVVEYEDEETVCKSRNGNIFTSLAKVNVAIGQMMSEIELTREYPPMAFDGEICVIDDEGNEDFSQAVSQVKRKDTEMEHPKYVIFDVIPLDEFREKSGHLTYMDRLDILKSYLDSQKSPYLEIIEAVPFSEDNYQMMKERCAKEGWEGLMLRKNVGYEGKRTKNLLKVKEFFTEEFEVMGWDNGIFRVINPDTGLEEPVKMLASVKILYKGDNIVDVGSGFSLAQRKEFYDDPNKIVGKTITVQYFETTTNKKGGTSLRFPTLKRIWENGRDI